MKIAHKISVFFLIVSFICLSFTLGFIYLFVQKSLTQAVYVNLVSNTHSRTKHVETYLEMARDSVIQASQSVVLPKLLKTSPDDPSYKDNQQNATRLLKSKKESDDSVVEYLLLDNKGRVAASSNEASVGMDKSSNAYFTQVKKVVYIKDAYFGNINKKPLIAISAPLFDNSNKALLGVLVVKLNLEILNNIMTERVGLGKSGEIFIINRSGYMITPSRFLKGTFLKLKVDTLNSSLAMKDKGSHSHDEENFVVYKDYRGIESMGAHDYIPQMQWYVLGRIDASEALLPLKSLRDNFILWFLIAGGTSWFLGQFIGRLIARPIQKLYKGAQIIGKGNLDHKIDLKSQDEIGELAEAFNDMTSNLKQTTASLSAFKEEQKERQQAEMNLKEKEEEYRILFENSREAMMTADFESGKFLSGNKECLRLFGCKDEAEFLTYNVITISPERQPDGMLSSEKFVQMRDIVQKQGFHLFEWSHQQINGREFPGSVFVSKMETKRGKIALSSVRDITQQKVNEKKLKEQADQLLVSLAESRKSREILASMLEDNKAIHQRLEENMMVLDKEKNNLQRIFDASQVGLILINSKGVVTRVNQALATMVGRNPDELLMESPGEAICCIHPVTTGVRCGESSACQECSIRDIFERTLKGTGQQIESIETERELVINNKRVQVWLNINAAPVEIDGERNALLSIVNVTERKNSEIKLIQLKNTAETANKAKSDFLSNMSHEIRTPMNAVLGFSHLLTQTQLDEKQERFLGIIVDSGKHLMNIINDILDLSKISSGKMILDKKSFDLRKTVTYSLAIVEPLVKVPDVSIEANIDPQIKGNFLGDPIRLQQVLINLLGNAVKFTAAGKIILTVRRQEVEQLRQLILFKIQDTGIGISAKELNEIFTPFVQADMTVTKKFGGTGLGLSISKSVVECMGGELKVQSQPGIGSEFFFSIWFPVTREIQYEGLTPEIKIQKEISKGLRLLIAEDNPANQALMQEFITDIGCTADYVSNGQEAVDLLKKDPKKYHMCFMDIQMPVMDGIDATKLIRESISKDIPIIALTAFAMTGEKERLLEFGLTDYLAKPVFFDSLRDMIQKYNKI